MSRRDRFPGGIQGPLRFRYRQGTLGRGDLPLGPEAGTVVSVFAGWVATRYDPINKHCRRHRSAPHPFPAPADAGSRAGAGARPDAGEEKPHSDRCAHQYTRESDRTGAGHQRPDVLLTRGVDDSYIPCTNTALRAKSGECSKPFRQLPGHSGGVFFCLFFLPSFFRFFC